MHEAASQLSTTRTRRGKHVLVMLHDAGCALLSYWFAATIIMPLRQLTADASVVLPLAAVAAVCVIATSSIFGVFSTRWRLASLIDFVALIKSVTLLTVFLLVARQIAHIFQPEPFFVAEVRIIILGSILTLGSQASGRIAYRYFRFKRRSLKHQGKRSEITIFVGSVSELDGALRAAEQDALSTNIAGALLLSGSTQIREVRGCKIFGNSADLEIACELLSASGQHVTSVLLSSGLLGRPQELRDVKRTARRLGLNLLKIEAVNVGGQTELRLEEFLFRQRTTIDHRAVDVFLGGKKVAITGGGGSIGGDIAMRAAAHGASEIVLLDISELGLQSRIAQLRKEFPLCNCIPVICDVRDLDRLTRSLTAYRPDVLVHAAALKHVDLTEENWSEAIKTNIFGTANVLEGANSAQIPVLVNISTDKAADPVGILGMTKHFTELLVGASTTIRSSRRLSVRFGNVLGSSGSVIDVFLAQIAGGGPITLTHPDVRRFFMSRNEAAELVLAAASMENGPDRNLYVLEMGEQIAIKDLAYELIEWAGLVPEQDIKFAIVGLRPGERLEEKLTGENERLKVTELAGIQLVEQHRTDGAYLSKAMDSLRRAITEDDKSFAVSVLQDAARRRWSETSVSEPDEQLHFSAQAVLR